jgi:hypothetical protein
MAPARNLYLTFGWMVLIGLEWNFLRIVHVCRLQILEEMCFMLIIKNMTTLWIFDVIACPFYNHHFTSAVYLTIQNAASEGYSIRYKFYPEIFPIVTLSLIGLITLP